MSAADVHNSLVRLLEERPENWRMLVDLAIDFAPPHAARAAGLVMSDPTADPNTVLEAVRTVPDVAFEDTPLHIGSIEPETLDFAPVSTISDDLFVQTTEIDFDFGAGTHESFEALDELVAIDATEEFDERAAELDDGLTPDRFETLDDDLDLVGDGGFRDGLSDDVDGDLDGDDEDDWDLDDVGE